VAGSTVARHIKASILPAIRFLRSHRVWQTVSSPTPFVCSDGGKIRPGSPSVARSLECPRSPGIEHNNTCIFSAQRAYPVSNSWRRTDRIYGHRQRTISLLRSGIRQGSCLPLRRGELFYR